MSWKLLWATHGFPVRALVYRGCPCRDPPVCHRVQGDSVAKRQPLLCVCVLVLLESRRRVCLALVFVVVHHAHVQLRILTHLLDWKLCPSSPSSPFSVLRIISTKFSAVSGAALSRTRHLVRHVLHLVRNFLASCGQCRTPSCSRKCTKLFLSRKLDHFRMLSRLCVCPWISL